MLPRGDLLELAKQHVEEARKRVDRQRKVVENLNFAGRDTKVNEEVLRLFERLQAKVEADQARLSSGS